MKKSYSDIPDYKDRQYQPKRGVSAHECVALCLMALVLGIILGAIVTHAQTAETHDAMPISTKTAAQPPSRQYPDKTLTPGVTRTVSQKVLCTAGSTKDARHVTEATKRAVFERYGFKKGLYDPGAYEVDHLVSLELGGANDIGNLWPEPYAGEFGARQKDVVETALHRCICSGKLTIAVAQAIIKDDWIKAYKANQAGTLCP